jgi:predicted O-methyltransferase YrrM
LISRLEGSFKRLPYLKQLYQYIADLKSDNSHLKNENTQLRQMIEQLKSDFSTVETERDQLNIFLLGEIKEKNTRGVVWLPPGHYHSPIPNNDEIRQRETIIFDTSHRTLPAVDMNEQEQVATLEALSAYFSEYPFEANKSQDLRYYFQNDYYAVGDGLILYGMLRHLKPKKVIEIGSGFSSALTLDVNQKFLEHSIACCFIEPYPERLYELLSEEDKAGVEIIERNLQAIPLEKFQELEAGDILFIDSTHVSKTGSDVNYLLFEILPALKEGVYIHIHDIFYPFEYPKEWVYQGRAWNEAYTLRAFLQYNTAFKVVFYGDFINNFYQEKLHEVERLPLVLKNTNLFMGNIWLRKSAAT